MYTRELQNSIPILNDFKQTGQSNKDNKGIQFSDVIGKRYQQNISSQTDITFISKSQSEPVKKDLFKQDQVKQNPVKQNASESIASNQQTKDDSATVDQKETSETEMNSKTNSAENNSKPKEVKNESADDSESISDEEKALKEKLAKRLKVSADELDLLMSVLNMDLKELEQLVNVESVDLTLIQEICTTLSQIEISTSLDGSDNLDKTLMNQLSNQIKTLIEPLQNQVMDVTEGDESTFSEIMDKINALFKQAEQSSQDKQIGDIESKVQDVEMTDEDTSVLFERIKALSVKSEVSGNSDIQSNKQTEQDQKIAVEGSVGDVSGETVSDKGLTKDLSGQKSDSSEDQNEVETSFEVTKEGDLVMVKTDSESNAILDQITLKQPNSMTNGIQNNASSTLRTNIFSQIMDSVKANIKLDDNGSHMLMKLNPDQLGNVELKISIHKGVVLAEINVENEMVKAAVESNLDDLKQSLTQKGYQLNQINVSIDSGKKEQDQQFAFNKGKRSKKEVLLDDLDDVTDSLFEKTGYQDHIYETSTINYYG